MSPWLISPPYGQYYVGYHMIHIDYFTQWHGRYSYENEPDRHYWNSGSPVVLNSSSNLLKNAPNEPQQSLRSIFLPKWIVSVTTSLMVTDVGDKFLTILIWDFFVANILGDKGFISQHERSQWYWWQVCGWSLKMLVTFTWLFNVKSGHQHITNDLQQPSLTSMTQTFKNFIKIEILSSTSIAVSGLIRCW